VALCVWMWVWVCAQAGFVDVKIKRIGPEWYRGVRRHGLIMGCSVTGVKPKVGGGHVARVHAVFTRANGTCAENSGKRKQKKRKGKHG
jgi:hypothetical protein